MLLLLLLSRFSRVRLCETPETAAHQAPLPLGFSRQEHWSLCAYVYALGWLRFFLWRSSLIQAFLVARAQIHSLGQKIP